ncbi:GerMN domain-containing protein [Dysosmobacter sp.]|uniref:GerMN domain-containing protein n=1 Tax=Dysosmobacter sp. TaxID=2591382 RepID=UPI001BB485A9|nr:GerMN domain-containing protein [Dysosmobacter sp.]MCI6053662.1 GerMN domain-containing protein [Dysosmobacter sp.]MDY5509676.1 GerMN domain-containing protein [Dysosmobacter sp.]QUO37411.1 GerMN domain-containing protein [Dysosmobacter sp. Marseille-Q4140]
MRKLVSLLLCAAALLSGCARGGESQQGTAYSLYFLEADLESVPGGDALRAETVYLEEDLGTTALAEALVERLLEGPSDATLENPIPAGTSLLSLELNGAYAKVDLSSNYRSLSGVALTLADYAITLTLTQLPQIAIVSITVRGQDLAYRDTQTFTARDVLLSSNEDVIGTVPATLYFLDEEGRLTPEERTLDLYEGDTQVSAVARALELGPENRSLRLVQPEEFQVKSVWLEEDVCYVNLSSSQLETLPEETDMPMILQALALSLCSLDTVSEVRFLVDGDFAAEYGGASIADPYIV